MCSSCTARADKLRELTARFEALAREGGDPLTTIRLSQTAQDLASIAARMMVTCDMLDVVWDDQSEAASVPAQLGLGD